MNHFGRSVSLGVGSLATFLILSPTFYLCAQTTTTSAPQKRTLTKSVLKRCGRTVALLGTMGTISIGIYTKSWARIDQVLLSLAETELKMARSWQLARMPSSEIRSIVPPTPSKRFSRSLAELASVYRDKQRTAVDRDRALFEITWTLQKMRDSSSFNRPLISDAAVSAFVGELIISSHPPAEAVAETMFWLSDYGTIVNDFGNFNKYYRGPLFKVATFIADALSKPMLPSGEVRKPSEFYLTTTDDYSQLTKQIKDWKLKRLNISLADSLNETQDSKLSQDRSKQGRKQGYIQIGGEADHTGRIEHFLYNALIAIALESSTSTVLTTAIDTWIPRGEFILRHQNASISDFRVNYWGLRFGQKLMRSPPANINDTLFYTWADESGINPIIPGPLKEGDGDLDHLFRHFNASFPFSWN